MAVLTIDISHPPLASADAERELSRALTRVELSASLRILKIIHGYGSKGKGGVLKTTTANWAFGIRRRVRDVFSGESLDPFSPRVQKMCAECGGSVSGITAGGEGVTIIWVK